MTFNVLEHLGSLQRLSPEEFGHVLLFATEKAILEKCDNSVLRAWLKCWRTIPATFEEHEVGDARNWRGQNIREQLVDTGVTVKRTVRQTVHDVAGFKREVQKKNPSEQIGSARVAKEY